LSSGGSSLAQELPAGTLLPIALRTGIDSAKAKAGQAISGMLGQDVILASGTRLNRGSVASGHIVEVIQATGGSAARVVLAFDRLQAQRHIVPLTVGLRALASANEVFEAELPTNVVDDYGSSVRDWNTRQVGGQGVYRGAGTLVSGPDVVGRASWVGEVYAVPRARPHSRCTADPIDDSREQSLWVFSSDACGPYGFEQLTIQHAGRTAPVGEIVLTAPGRLKIRAGSGWLLTVLAAPGPSAAGN
jgi:hypothetical protein